LIVLAPNSSLSRKGCDGNKKADKMAFFRGNMAADGTFPPNILSLDVNTICIMGNFVGNYVSVA
jgi:hypothetical protein